MTEGVNNTMWGPLLEKAYAKFIGSYENIAAGGTTSEAIRALAGLPGFMYNTTNVTGLFDMIAQALSNGDIVTCSTPTKNKFLDVVLN